MRIEIDNKVKKYLNKKCKNIISVNMFASDSSDIHVATPVIKLNEPNNTNEYNIYEIDNITIYIHKNIRTKDTLRFYLVNYIFTKSIDVIGIKII